MFTVIKAFFSGLFGSLLERLWPVKTAADVEAKQAEDNVVILQAQARAAADSPTQMEQLIKEQQDGRV